MPGQVPNRDGEVILKHIDGGEINRKVGNNFGTLSVRIRTADGQPEILTI
jgi:hypothetical protein